MGSNENGASSKFLKYSISIIVATVQCAEYVHICLVLLVLPIHTPYTTV